MVGLQAMRHLLMAFVLVGFTGCVGLQIEPLAPEKKQVSYAADFNTTWRAVLDVLNDWSMPITAIEKESGIIVTDFVIMKAPSDAFPMGPMGSMELPQAGRLKLNISVREENGKTTIKINAHHERLTQHFGEMSASWKAQNSTGHTEFAIFMSVSLILRGGGRTGIGIDPSATITEVVDGGPASIAGLKIGDKLIKVDGRSISEDFNPVYSEIVGNPGTLVELIVMRNGKELKFLVERQIIK